MQNRGNSVTSYIMNAPVFPLFSQQKVLRIEKVQIVRPRVLNLINPGDGQPLSKLHRAEGLCTAGLDAAGL